MQLTENEKDNLYLLLESRFNERFAVVAHGLLSISLDKFSDVTNAKQKFLDICEQAEDLQEIIEAIDKCSGALFAVGIRDLLKELEKLMNEDAGVCGAVTIDFKLERISK